MNRENKTPTVKEVVWGLADVGGELRDVSLTLVVRVMLILERWMVGLNV
jgi:hypothetical protein